MPNAQHGAQRCLGRRDPQNLRRSRSSAAVPRWSNAATDACRQTRGGSQDAGPVPSAVEFAPMRVLAIESSCDESAVALLDEHAGLLAHELFSQIDLHRI